MHKVLLVLGLGLATAAFGADLEKDAREAGRTFQSKARTAGDKVDYSLHARNGAAHRAGRKVKKQGRKTSRDVKQGANRFDQKVRRTNP